MEQGAQFGKIVLDDPVGSLPAARTGRDVDDPEAGVDEIRFFNRDRAVYSWLRNFYSASITWDRARWPSSEHLYQAMKTSNKGERRRIRFAPTPDEAKRLGSGITVGRAGVDEAGRDALRSAPQFQQNPELAERLLATGDARLVEDSPDDRFGARGTTARVRTCSANC